mmetsp:Transcript_29147/g.70967  ORF Transcript_29147/g.70967 Transcript_29147/m.70967 type:complete len:96 (-) Transcript_29147:34-321(-)
MYMKAHTSHSSVDAAAPDFRRHPRFAEVLPSGDSEDAARYVEMIAVLQRGDCLFIPAFWFHHVTSGAGRSQAVNFWYRPHSRSLEALMAALLPNR